MSSDKVPTANGKSEVVSGESQHPLPAPNVNTSHSNDDEKSE